jgi:hypothetical protein
VSRLIAVTGYKTSGKNAVCDVLRDSFGFKITGFADALKAQFLAIDPYVVCDSYSDGVTTVHDPLRLSQIVGDMGWDAAKEDYPEVRRLLQKGGTEGGRDIFGQDIWIVTWMRNVDALLEAGYDVCVSDMRFINEASAVRAMGGQVWRVYRPGTGPGEHRSENELDRIEADVMIMNDGTLEDLAVVVKKLMEKK